MTRPDFAILSMLLAAILAAAGPSCGRSRETEGSSPAEASRARQGEAARPGLTAARLEPGDHEFSLRHARVRRHYRVHVPTATTAGEPPPLVLMIHGAGGNARATQAHYGWDALADAEGFIVVYPDGSGGIAGRVGLTWNAGTCCGDAWEANADDLGFILSLLDDFARRQAYDPTRVYATGHSNGGMMWYHLARSAPERFAAIAAVSGVSLDTGILPTLSMPVLHIHSEDDPIAHWEGGVTEEARAGHLVVAGSVEESIAWWVRANRCEAMPTRVRRPAWRPERGTPHTAEEITWRHGRDGSEVKLIRLTGAGHGWPGPGAMIPLPRLGPNTRVIDATEEAWRFLSRFRRPSP